MAGADDRTQAGSAEPVDGHARDRLRQAREQRRHPRDVAVVLAGLVRGAEVDVFDLARRNSGARDRLCDHERREVIRPLAGKRAAVAPDGRANGGEDYGAAHAATLSNVRLRRSWPAAIALLLLLLLSACGGSRSEGSRSEQKVGGWSTHHVADGGFSLQVPAAWRTLDKLDASSVDHFLADNPQFEPYRQVFTSGLIKLIAFDPDVAAGFATNMNVLVHNLGTSMSLSQYADATKAQIAHLTGAEPQLRLVRLPAGRCARSIGQPARSSSTNRRTRP